MLSSGAFYLPSSRLAPAIKPIPEKIYWFINAIGTRTFFIFHLITVLCFSDARNGLEKRFEWLGLLPGGALVASLRESFRRSVLALENAEWVFRKMERCQSEDSHSLAAGSKHFESNTWPQSLLPWKFLNSALVAPLLKHQSRKPYPSLPKSSKQTSQTTQLASDARIFPTFNWSQPLIVLQNAARSSQTSPRRTDVSCFWHVPDEYRFFPFFDGCFWVFLCASFRMFQHRRARGRGKFSSRLCDNTRGAEIFAWLGWQLLVCLRLLNGLFSWMNSFHALLPPFVVVSMPRACNSVTPEPSRESLCWLHLREESSEWARKEVEIMEMKDNESAVVLNGMRGRRILRARPHLNINCGSHRNMWQTFMLRRWTLNGRPRAFRLL